MMDDQNILALPSGYRLGKYAFKGVLGSGGFGITYLADDTSLERKVAIKEMLPNDFATRLDGTTVVAKTQTDKTNLDWARARFMDEGRALAACDHPNVIDVYEMLEANGTAYMVTQFQEGCNLEQWFRNLQRRPSEKELCEILLPLLSGLEKVHRTGFLHRDIKPENIYITFDGRPVLLDFGSARQAIRGRSMVMTSIVTPGYAPFEQYQEDGHQGPWTDIYALGAVMYRGVTGKKPPEALRRMSDDSCEILAATYVGQYRSRFLQSIDRTLKLKESDRPQTVAAWRDLLGSDLPPESKPVVVGPDQETLSIPLTTEPSRATGTQTNQTSKPETEQPRTIVIHPFFVKYRGILAAVSIVAVAALAGVIYSGFQHPNISNGLPTPQPNVTPREPGQVDPHSLAVVPSPTPVAEKPSTTPEAPSATPQVPATTPAQNVVAVTPAPIAIENQRLPAHVVSTPAPAQPVATPNTVSSPTANAAQIDPKLLAKWKHEHAKDGQSETWDLQPDGNYLLSGSEDQSGTFTTSDGKIEQYPSSGNPQELSYKFVGGKLVTRTADGVETIWVLVSKHMPGQATGSPSRDNGRSSTHHRPDNSGKDGDGILPKVKRFFHL
jgi:serine/threonine protein kinase